jgi:hypothetical protein
VNHLFDCFLELRPFPVGANSLPANVDHKTNSVERPEGEAIIVKRYPASYDDDEILRSVGQFCFPCPQMQHETITHFSFVLTAIDSRWTFGFCRHLPSPDRSCLLLLSSLPWHDTFFKLLNHLSALIQAQDVSASLRRNPSPILTAIKASFSFES